MGISLKKVILLKQFANVSAFLSGILFFVQAAIWNELTYFFTIVFFPIFLVVIHGFIATNRMQQKKQNYAFGFTVIYFIYESFFGFAYIDYAFNFIGQLIVTNILMSVGALCALIFAFSNLSADIAFRVVLNAINTNEISIKIAIKDYFHFPKYFALIKLSANIFALIAALFLIFFTLFASFNPFLIVFSILFLIVGLYGIKGSVGIWQKSEINGYIFASLYLIYDIIFIFALYIIFTNQLGFVYSFIIISMVLNFFVDLVLNFHMENERKYHEPLSQIFKLIESHQYEQAVAIFNEKAIPSRLSKNLRLKCFKNLEIIQKLSFIERLYNANQYDEIIDKIIDLKTSLEGDPYLNLIDSELQSKITTIYDQINDYMAQNKKRLRMELQTFSQLPLSDQMAKGSEALDDILLQANHYHSQYIADEVKNLIAQLDILNRMRSALEDFMKQFPRIHILELSHSIQLSQSAIKPFLEKLIQQGIIPAKYDPVSNGIEFYPTSQIPSENGGNSSDINLPPTFVYSKSNDSKFKIGNIFQTDQNTYVILSKLAEGGMGLLYLAENQDSHQKVVIKQLIPYAYSKISMGFNSCQEYWEREAQIISKQSAESTNSMHLIEAVHRSSSGDQEDFCLILEYIEGLSMDKWIQRTSNPSDITTFQMELAEIILPLCQHLIFTHSCGIIHRDITPKNILLHNSDKGLIPVLIDWGMAKEIPLEEMYSPPNPYFTETRAGATGIHSVGNPPEVTGGYKPVAASDIYMLGHVLFFLLTNGRFQQIPKTNAEYVLSPQVFNPLVPNELNSLVERMTQYEPADRIESMTAVKNEIEVLLTLPELSEDNMPNTYFQDDSQ